MSIKKWFNRGPSHGLSDEQRFWEKVDKRAHNDCWEWKAGINSTGRGIFWYKGKSIHAHRFAWLISRGKIPRGKQVCHHCDNPGCVNPNHLFLGSHRDNMRDMINKGRKVTLRGEKDPKSILTRDEVVKIKRLYKNQNVTQYELADMFGVSRSCIQAIVNGKSWKHVK